MRVGLDLDGVTFNWSGAVRKALAQHRGIEDVGESTHWDYVKERIPAEDWRWVWTDGIAPVFGQVDAHYPGAPSFMQRLTRLHDVVVVTHRPREAASYTLSWLGRHRVCPESVFVVGSAVEKSTLWADVEAAIDDKPEVCDDMLENTRAHVFMPNRLWNEGYKPPAGTSRRFHTYDNLKEVLEWLEARTRR